MHTQQEITQLLTEAQQGSSEALNHLLPIVYDELQRIAHLQLRHERRDHTLNTVALVHEAYLKLVDQNVQWQNRAHFFAVASIAMRRVLVSYARARQRLKRGNGAERVPIESVEHLISDDTATTILQLDQALTQLSAVNQRAARVVECRFFGGLSIEETAEALEVSPITVKRDWTLAKAWLRREIEG
ncbi:MAG: sigma-70 family RNA polymerase sigma factor [Chlorobi bacterium]|nr:MAG: RNA polymerase sigma factor SigD [Chlorobi bacterium OLB7]MBK8910491.1 sigma-70 family RNA polymerase sigma factor [Chlorobiota bacterium]